MGYLTRSSGIVATLLIIAALVWGFFFSSRATGNRLRPNWWLDLHNWLGGLALIFTGIHILAAWLTSDSGIGIVQILIPGTSDIGWALTWGVLGAYLFAAAVFTTWPKRWRRRPWWRVVHLLSVAGTVFALIHTYQMGSDATQLVFRIGFILSIATATYAMGLRVATLLEKKVAKQSA